MKPRSAPEAAGKALAALLAASVPAAGCHMPNQGTMPTAPEATPHTAPAPERVSSISPERIEGIARCIRAITETTKALLHTSGGRCGDESLYGRKPPLEALNARAAESIPSCAIEVSLDDDLGPLHDDATSRAIAGMLRASLDLATQVGDDCAQQERGQESGQ